MNNDVSIYVPVRKGLNPPMFWGMSQLGGAPNGGIGAGSGGEGRGGGGCEPDSSLPPGRPMLGGGGGKGTYGGGGKGG